LIVQADGVDVQSRQTEHGRSPAVDVVSNAPAGGSPAVASISNVSDKVEVEADTDHSGQAGVDFLRFLINNFDDQVLNFLDQDAKRAILQQKKISDEKEFKRVKLAIESRVLDLLLKKGNMSGTPSAGFFRKIVGVLATRYSYMFLDDPKVTVQGITVRKFSGKGTGGIGGISALPKVLRQKFSRMLEDKAGVVKRREAPDDTDEQQARRKKRKVYGVSSERYYIAGTADNRTFLSDLDNMDSTEKREQFFCRHRENVQHILSTSVDLLRCVPGFFSHLSHINTHFEWLTGKNLVANIEKELPRQFRLLKGVVVHMCPTKEFQLSLEIAKIKGAERNGTYIPELICLLRELNMLWHKNRGGLLRYPSEPESNSPHIFCRHGLDGLQFDLHVEQKQVFSALNFTEVLAAFFCLAFIGNLHYPEEAEAVAVLLQRKVAGINDEGKFFSNKIVCWLTK
jgi:hypothetical protein